MNIKMWSDDELEAERIQAKKDSRRNIMLQQIEADKLKSQLCDQLREEKQKVPGLQQRINLLSHSDPELFTYIQRLEFVQYGIWCPKCDQIKNIGVPRPKNVSDSAPKKVSVENVLRAEIDDLKKGRDELQSRIDKMSGRLAKLEKQLSMIGENVNIAPNIADTVRREDLPMRSVYQVNEVKNIMSADDLFNSI